HQGLNQHHEVQPNLVAVGNILNLAKVPKGLNEGYEHDETFLRKMYTCCLSFGIPNMLLSDMEKEI
ncbi:hypothetical protein A6R68_00131, partial [Neotoma lepida]